MNRKHHCAECGEEVEFPDDAKFVECPACGSTIDGDAEGAADMLLDELEDASGLNENQNYRRYAKEAWEAANGSSGEARATLARRLEKELRMTLPAHVLSTKSPKQMRDFFSATNWYRMADMLLTSHFSDGGYEPMAAANWGTDEFSR